VVLRVLIMRLAKVWRLLAAVSFLVLASSSHAAGVDFSGVVAAVDWGTVVAAILWVANALLLVRVVSLSVWYILAAIR